MAEYAREVAPPEIKSAIDKKDYNSDFMKTMRDNYDRARQREHENIIEAYLDLGFRCGDAQWDSAAYNDRQAERRPCMIVNIIPQFVRQVTGDIRHNCRTHRIDVGLNRSRSRSDMRGFICANRCGH